MAETTIPTIPSSYLIKKSFLHLLSHEQHTLTLIYRLVSITVDTNQLDVLSPIELWFHTQHLICATEQYLLGL